MILKKLLFYLFIPFLNMHALLKLPLIDLPKICDLLNF